MGRGVVPTVPHTPTSPRVAGKYMRNGVGHAETGAVDYSESGSLPSSMPGHAGWVKGRAGLLAKES